MSTNSLYSFTEKLPAGWQFRTLKSICSYISDGSHFSPELVDDGEKYITVSNVYDNLVHSEEAGTISKEDFSILKRNGCQPKKGDILLAKDGTVGRSAIVDDNNYVVLSSLGIIRPTRIVTPQYLKYALDSSVMQEQMKADMAGSALKRITIRKISQLVAIVPPINDQNRIVSYLDEKCADIDNNISILNQKKEKYELLKKSIIQQAVTKGLNPDVEMKESGVEWIDTIPTHWSMTRILNTSTVGAYSFIDGDWIESPDISDYGIRYLTSGNVGALKYKEQGRGYITEETFTRLGCKEVFPGDLLISRLNLPIGRTCMVPDLGERIVTCVDNVIYRPDPKYYDKEYLVYLMNCNSYSSYVSMLGRGATMQRISRTQLAKVKIIVPPLSEQVEIRNYLNEKCSVIDKNLELIESQIDKYIQLKKALINEVITGQRAV